VVVKKWCVRAWDAAKQGDLKRAEQGAQRPTGNAAIFKSKDGAWCMEGASGGLTSAVKRKVESGPSGRQKPTGNAAAIVKSKEKGRHSI
jgi:hypothetical protein